MPEEKNEEQNTIPWIPGMRALDEDGMGWRFTAGAIWFPDDAVVDKPKPNGKLTADFADLVTGVVVEWLVKQAQTQNTMRAEEAEADPTHPDNIGALLAGKQAVEVEK